MGAVIYLPKKIEPVRVAHIVHGFETGGLEHGIVKLLNALPPEAYRHALISLTQIGPLVENLKVPEMRFLALQKGEGNDPKLVYTLATALKQFKPHVIRTYGWPRWIEGTVAGAIAGVRAHVHSEHGLYFY